MFCQLQFNALQGFSHYMAIFFFYPKTISKVQIQECWLLFMNMMYMHIGNHSHIVETVPLSKLVHYCKLPINCIVETVTDLQEVWKGGRAAGATL